jgi:hypothetical protein
MYELDTLNRSAYLQEYFLHKFVINKSEGTNIVKKSFK